MEKMISILFCMLLLSLSTVTTAVTDNNPSHSKTQIAVLSEDLLQAKTMFDPLLLKGEHLGPGYYDTSEYFAG